MFWPIPLSYNSDTGHVSSQHVHNHNINPSDPIPLTTIPFFLEKHRFQSPWPKVPTQKHLSKSPLRPTYVGPLLQTFTHHHQSTPNLFIPFFFFIFSSLLFSSLLFSSLLFPFSSSLLLPSISVPLPRLTTLTQIIKFLFSDVALLPKVRDNFSQHIPFHAPIIKSVFSFTRKWRWRTKIDFGQITQDPSNLHETAMGAIDISVQSHFLLCLPYSGGTSVSMTRMGIRFIHPINRYFK